MFLDPASLNGIVVAGAVSRPDRPIRPGNIPGDVTLRRRITRPRYPCRCRYRSTSRPRRYRSCYQSRHPWIGNLSQVGIGPCRYNSSITDAPTGGERKKRREIERVVKTPKKSGSVGWGKIIIIDWSQREFRRGKSD